MRATNRRLILIDLLALGFLAISMFYPWPSGLHDYKAWTLRVAFAILSSFTVARHLIVNVGPFKTPAYYVWVVFDVLVLMVALLWLLNLLIGLQGMS